MTRSDLERRVTEVLQRHAEDAMGRTDTEGQLDILLARAKRDTRRRRQAWVAGALAAAAAVAVAVAMWGSDLEFGPPEPVAPAPVEPATTPAEELALTFLGAYESYDVERAESYLGEDAKRKLLLADELPFNEATGFELLVDSCEEQAGSPSGTEVRCDYDYHAMHSNELGRGPFSGSWFDFTVLDGEMVDASQLRQFDFNGFNMQMWEPFRQWVSQAYPEDARIMYTESGGTNLSQQAGQLELWSQHLREYVEVAKGSSPASSSS
jgi:hypothetical protein